MLRKIEERLAQFSAKRRAKQDARGWVTLCNLKKCIPITLFEPAALVKAMAGVFVCSVLASPSLSAVLPTNCSSLGGTLVNGVCKFVGLNLGNTYSAGANNNWSLKSGNALIQATDSKCGIYVFSFGGGTDTTYAISNDGSGTFTIAGGSNFSYYGIGRLTYYSSSGAVRNTNSGSFIIQGGGRGAGISYVANGSKANSVIENTGNGTFSISGGASGNGISFGGSDKGSCLIRNASSGTFNIEGGTSGGNGISFLTDYNGTGTIRNEGTGSFTIRGSAGAGGIYKLANEGCVASVENTGSGNFTISGGTGGYGIGTAVDYGGYAAISNKSTGVFIIQGNASSGISTASTSKGSTTLIENTGGGIFVIQGISAFGIRTGASDSANTAINNASGSTMKILGVESFFGINQLISGSASTTITNSGILEMNAYAIGSFGGSNANGIKSFINKSTGRLKAEVGTLFQDGSLANGTFDSVARFVNPNGAFSSSKFGSFTGTDALNWTLKDDWVNYAQFEDGSTIEFSDVTEGTPGAADIKAKFEAVFGPGTAVKFAKPDGDIFNLSVANTILASSPGAVFYDTDFTTEGAVSIGSGITGNTGFRTVRTGGSSVTVESEKQLTLIGDASKPILADGTLAIEGSLILGNENISSGGRIVSSSSRKAFSSLGSGLTVKSGDFSIEAHGNTAMDLLGSTIENAGTGTFVIRGDDENTGCPAITYGSKSEGGEVYGRIVNSGGGTLVIEAGDSSPAIYEGSHRVGGIQALSADTLFAIMNGPASTMKISGNPETGTYAVEYPGANRYLGFETATIANEGRMILNTNAFRDLNNCIFWNRASGIIEAEVGTMFTGGTITQTTGTVSSSDTVVLPDGSTKTVSGGQVESTIYESSGTWTLKSDWQNYAQFDNGGTVIFTNLNEGSAAAADIQSKFEAVFGTGTTIKFAPAPSGGKLDSSSINDALASNDGAVFFDKGFQAPSDNLIIGNSGDLRGSTGFQTLTGASNVQVESGKKFTLLGDGTNATSAALNLNAGSEMDLGSLSEHVTAAQGGALGAIGGAGTINVKKGAFTSTSISGSNTVNVESGSSLVASTIASGAINAKGKLASAAEFIASGSIEVDTAGSVRGSVIKSTGSLTNKGVTSANRLEISGAISNSGVIDAVEFVAAGTEYLSAGTEIYQQFRNSGIFIITDQTNLVIGDVARKEWLLDDMKKGGNVAERLLAAGSSLPSEVRDALAEKGIDVAAIEAQALQVAEVEPPAPQNEQTEGEAETASSAQADAAVPENTDEAPESSTVENESAGQDGDEAETIVITPQVFIPEGSLPTGLAALGFEAASQDMYAIESQALQNAIGAWASLVTGKSEFSAYEANRYGVRVGLQGSNGDLTLGTALTYTDGNLDWYGKRDRSTMSAHLYGSYRMGPATLAATASYGRDKLEGDGNPESDLVSASLRAGFDMAFGSMTVTPHAGFRVIRVDVDDIKASTIMQYPVGVSLTGHLEAAGWDLRPVMDASFVFQTGDRHMIVDGIESVIAGKHAAQTRFGLEAQKDNWTIGVDYSGAFGSESYRSHSLNLKAVLAF